MIYRGNLALPPRARGREVALSEMIAEAVARCSVCRVEDAARNVLSQASRLPIPAGIMERAEDLARRVGAAPLGSGRIQARDHGGRVGQAVMAWSERIVADADRSFADPLRVALGRPGPSRGEWERTLDLWGLAWPRTARAVDLAMQYLRDVPTPDQAVEALQGALAEWDILHSHSSPTPSPTPAHS